MSNSRPRVFISHSHENRDVALELKGVLADHGAETFLDQEHIGPGNTLPSRLSAGIEWCSTLLLLWSRQASRSTWVQKECDTAYTQRKRFLPYQLDGTRLPERLQPLVAVNAGDRNLGHAGLLYGVFERNLGFPGHWQVRQNLAAFNDPHTGQTFHNIGLPEGGYDLDLKWTGQAVGTFAMGGFGGLMGMFGGGGLMNMKVPAQGVWTYAYEAKILRLNLRASVMGQPVNDVIEVVLLEQQHGALRGESPDGRSWILQRVS